MADKSGITDRLLVQQKTMFRQAAVKGFTQELIHAETKLPTTSLSDWANGKAKMSLVGMLALAEVPDFPLELLSLILPSGMALVRVPSGIDHDQLAESFHDYLQTKEKAHHPESPAGREISDCEDASLRNKPACLRLVA